MTLTELTHTFKDCYGSWPVKATVKNTLKDHGGRRRLLRTRRKQKCHLQEDQEEASGN